MTPAELPATHHTVKVNGLNMHYAALGEGPLVVLLHGFPENWWSWRHQLQPLADAGFKVIVPDLRGYNETDKHGPYDLDTLSEDVCQLIDAVQPGKALIVGHDWGGALAWHLAATRPGYVERLCVLNCPHPARISEVLLKERSWVQLKKSWYMFFFQLPWLPERILTRDNGAAVVRALKGMAVDRSRFRDEAELAPFREGVQKPGAASGMLGWYRTAIRQGLRGGRRYEPIACETMLLWAMQDKALGFHELVPGTERFAPKLKVVPIENCGHFVQSEQPEAVTQGLLEFLKR